MKKLVLAILCMFALSSVALASPLTDYSKGNASLDINYRVSPDYDLDAAVNGYSIKEELPEGIPSNFDGDSNVEWGFTYGIGNNLALQYRQATPKGKLTAYDDYYDESDFSGHDSVKLVAKTRTEEYNVLYKLDKNFSLFTGVVRANPSVKVNAGSETKEDDVVRQNGIDVSIQGHDKNIWQFGVVAVKPLNKDLTSYGVAALGGDYRNLEVGLGYKIAKNVEFNVNYRDMKIEDMKMASATVDSYERARQPHSYDLTTDTTVKGWGFGVTYNF